MELTRQRNLVAERDSIIQSYESEMESWRDGVLAGFISLEDHYSEIEDARKESAKEVSQIKAELDAERNARMAAEARVRELEEAASEREEAHKEELAKANMEYICGPIPIKSGIELLAEDYRNLVVLSEDTIAHGQVIRSLDAEGQERFNRAWDRVKATEAK